MQADSATVLDVDGAGCIGFTAAPTGPVRPGPTGLDICISPDAENALAKDANGCLKVTAGDGLVIGPGGEIDVQPSPTGPVRVTPTGLDICLSTDPGNALVKDPDNGCLYVPSAGPGGLTSVSTTDSPTIDFSGDGTPGNPITAAAKISVDAGNRLTTGSDGALFVPPLPAPVFGQAELLNLNSSIGDKPENTWVDALDPVGGGPGLEITLPAAGTYRLGGAIRGIVARSETALVGGISLAARLLDVTAGVPVPLSGRMVVGFDSGMTSDNSPNVEGTSPVDLLYTVAGPTTLRLQGKWSGEIDAITPTTVSFRSYPDASVNPGRTILNFHKIA